MKIISLLITVFTMVFSHNALSNSFKTEKWVTKNGVRVVFYQAMEVPMLDISLAFAAGSAYDKEHFGLSALTSQMINQGNAGKDATTIAETLADTGAQFDAASSRDMTVLNLRTLTNKKALQKSITTFTHIVSHPDFPDEAFNREKKQQLMAIKQAEESPEDIANLKLFQTLYKAHPYSHSVNGTPKTVSALSKKQVVDFYKQYYVANNAILILVGAIDTKEAHQLADQITKDLPQGKRAAITLKAPQLTTKEQINIPFPSSQTVVRLGQVGIDHQNPNYFPLIVGNYILGGGALTSRLAVEVREKRGLTYGVTSQFLPMPGEGPFFISLSTQNNQANQALDITRQTLEQFINSGPEKQELESAKKYLTGSYPLSLAGNRNIADLLLRMNFYNLPDNYLDVYVARINAVTTEQIKEVFQQQVDPGKMALITVGQS